MCELCKDHLCEGDVTRVGIRAETWRKIEDRIPIENYRNYCAGQMDCICIVHHENLMIPPRKMAKPKAKLACKYTTEGGGKKQGKCYHANISETPLDTDFLRHYTSEQHRELENKQQQTLENKQHEKLKRE